MKKINFKNAHQVLSEKEMKNVLGGSNGGCTGCVSGEWCIKNGFAVKCSISYQTGFCGCN